MDLRRFQARYRRVTLGPLPGSTWGSKRRNRYSFLAAGVAALVLMDLLAGFGISSPRPALFAFCLFAPLYLYQISLAVIWLETDEFRVNAQRLVRDVTISICFSSIVFANFYWHVGIVPTFDSVSDIRQTDALYFSIVTFTTLGFGDFRPSEAARLIAAMQAMLGTVHIGLIVGAVYVAVGQNVKGTAK